MPPPDELAARLRVAAAAEDLGALHALVDWELTGAAPLVRALADVDRDDRAEVASRGLAEIELSARDPELVRSRLGDLSRAILAGQVEVIASGGAVDAARVPPAPDGLEPDQVRRLDELRARAAKISGALAARRPVGVDLPLPIAPGGERVVLVDGA
jgi:hypothetical protein